MIALLVAAAVSAASCYTPPVAAPVTSPFAEPACAYCPGHRGLGYDLPPFTVVVAIAAGEVTFAGQVAGVRWVVVQQADGRTASYGHLAAILVRRGQEVSAGQPLGLSGVWLHLGLRQGDAYLDPLPLLGAWVVRARLVPSNGDPGRSGPPPRLRCPAQAP